MTFENCRKSQEKLLFFAVLSIFGYICILSFSSNVFLIYSRGFKSLIAVILLFQSFMLTIGVRKVTKTSQKIVFFRNFWRDINVFVINNFYRITQGCLKRVDLVSSS